MAISFTGAHFPHDIILMGVRWYVAYPLHAAPLVHGSSHQCTMRGHLGAETRAL